MAINVNVCRLFVIWKLILGIFLDCSYAIKQLELFLLICLIMVCYILGSVKF